MDTTIRPDLVSTMPAGLKPANLLPAAPLALQVALPPLGSAEPLRLTRLTHASVLIQWGENALLTDPWFSQKPLYHHGESLPLAIADLPRLTGVLSSMDHYDHFDIATFGAYGDRSVPLVTIAGSVQREKAERAGFQNVMPLTAGDSVRCGDAVLHAIAANDFPPNSFRHEQAYVIEAAGRTILFCAHFLKPAALGRVRDQFGNIDVALLGINGLGIKPMLGRQLSMDPVDAAKVCRELHVRVAVPIHYAFNGGWFSSTFLLSHKGTPEQFSEAVRSISPSTSAITLAPGQVLSVVP